MFLHAARRQKRRTKEQGGEMSRLFLRVPRRQSNAGQDPREEHDLVTEKISIVSSHHSRPESDLETRGDEGKRHTKSNFSGASRSALYSSLPCREAALVSVASVHAPLIELVALQASWGAK